MGGATPSRFFHLGRYARRPVRIYAVEHGAAREVLYSESLFRYADPALAGKAAANGFAGFRAMNPGQESDWLAFQGASYFRSAAPVQPVRPVGPGAGDRHGHGGAGILSQLHHLLAGARRGRTAHRLRPARRPSGGRRLPHRQPAQCLRSGPGDRLRPLFPRRRRAAGRRPTDQHVLVRRERPAGEAGLAARDPRFRRIGALDGRRRADLAAAGRSAARNGQRLRRQKPARFRPTPARPGVRPLPGRRRFL